jgi:CarD family transcriptional regulator
MEFQVGDRVVHWAHGLGEIVQLDEKKLSGQTVLYYVVQIADLKLWVPVESPDPGSLRLPTAADEFEKLFTILRGPEEPLPEDRLERKRQLGEQMRDRSSASICRVIRDLTSYGRRKKLSENDQEILDRAKSFLLNEWRVSLSIPLGQAQRDLDELLGVNLA